MIPRSQQPFNEFTNNKALLVSSFPHLFPTGVGPVKDGSLNTADSRHLLLQFHGKFGTCSQLVFLLFNQLQRHGGCRGVSAAVKNNSAAFQSFSALSSDPEIEIKLEKAAEDPETPEAKALVKQLTNCVRVFSPMIPFSYEARRAKLGDFVAAMRHFARPLVYTTISPDPLGDVSAIRRTFPTVSNLRFPAVDEGFRASLLSGAGSFPHMARDATGDMHRVDTLTNYDNLLNRITVDSAASAEGFRLDLLAMFEVLYGIPLASDTKRTSLQLEARKGAFSAILAALAVIECSGKQTLHSHGLLWPRMPNWAFEAASGIPELHDVLLKFAQSIVSAELPAELHLQSLLRRINLFPPYRAPWHSTPMPDVDNTDFRRHVAFAAERTQVHAVHRSRCRKGKSGEKRCAMAMPRALTDGTPCDLESKEPNLAVKPRDLDSRLYPIDFDPRIIIVEPRRRAIDVHATLAPTEALSDTSQMLTDRHLPTSADASAAHDVSAPTPATSSTPTPSEQHTINNEAVVLQVADIEQRTPANTNVDCDPTVSNQENLAESGVEDIDQEFLGSFSVDELEADVRAAIAHLTNASELNGQSDLEELRNLAVSLNALLVASREGKQLTPSQLATLARALPRRYQDALRHALHERNGKLTDFNEIIMALRGCNVASYILSSGVAAKVALFYILDYVTKNPTKHASTLALAAAAVREAKLRPSIATNSGTEERTAQHVLHRLMFKLHGQAEYSAMLASAALLGAPPEPSSHQTKVLNVRHALQIACDGLAVANPAALCPAFDDSADRECMEEPHNDASSASLPSADDLFKQEGHAFSASFPFEVLDYEGILRGHGRRAATEMETSEGVVKPDIVDGKPVVPSLIEAYAHRPTELANFSLYEFFCVCSLAPRTSKKDTRSEDLDAKDEPAVPRGAGRPSNIVFRLQQSTPLSTTHHICLRSKHVIPKLCPPPPKYPSPSAAYPPSAAWKRTAHSFAQYALTLHCPWDITTHLPCALNWKQLCSFVDDCYNGSPTVGRFIGAVRLQWLKMLADSLAPNHRIKQCVMNFRNRCSKEWRSEDPDYEALFNRRPQRTSKDSAKDLDYDEDGIHSKHYEDAAQIMEALAAQHHAAISDASSQSDRVATFCLRTVENVKTVFTSASSATAQPGRDGATSLINTPLLEATPQEAKSKAGALRTNSVPASKHVDAQSPAVELKRADVRPRALTTPVPPLRPNNEQANVLQEMRDCVDAFVGWRTAGRIGSRPLQQLRFVHGGPGCGKSFVIRTAAEYAKEQGVHVIRVAPMGLPANLIGGMTVHAAIGMGVRSKWDDPLSSDVATKLREVHRIKDCCLIIIDEISAVGPDMLFSIDARFRVILGDKLPFGGLSVYVFGDFYQLPPVVPSVTLFDVVLQRFVYERDSGAKPMTEQHRSAAELFVRFRKTELQQNMRAAEDPDWAALVRNLRCAQIGKLPLKDYLIPLLPQLTIHKEDVVADEAWRLAPVCVSSNRARAFIIQTRAADVARRLGVPLVRWRLPLTSTVVEHCTREQLDELYANDPRLWGIFIQGGAAYLSENLKTEREVSNGTPVTMHSLILGDSFDPDERFDADAEAVRTAGPGDIVEISVPYSVNVVLEGKSPDDYADVTLVPGAVVIPLLCDHKLKYTVYLAGHIPLKVGVTTHPFDSAIACTFYKSQGRTMERVLACLNDPIQQPHLTFEAVFVFLSRVRLGRHCKVLPLHPGQNWSHLEELRPADNLLIYLNGFDPNTGDFDVDFARKAWTQLKALKPDQSKAKRRRSKSSTTSSTSQKKPKVSTAPLKRKKGQQSRDPSAVKTTKTSPGYHHTSTTKQSASSTVSSLSSFSSSPSSSSFSLAAAADSSSSSTSPRFSPRHLQLLGAFGINARRATELLQIKTSVVRGEYRLPADSPFIDVDLVDIVQGRSLVTSVVSHFMTRVAEVARVEPVVALNPLHLISMSYGHNPQCPQLLQNNPALCREFTGRLNGLHLLRVIIAGAHVPGHFFFLRLDHATSTIELLDPLGPAAARRSNRLQVAAALTSWINEEQATSGQPQPRYELAFNPPRLPTQIDAVSCGVLVCAYAYYREIHGRYPTSDDFTGEDHSLLRLVVLDACVSNRLRVPSHLVLPSQGAPPLAIASDDAEVETLSDFDIARLLAQTESHSQEDILHMIRIAKSIGTLHHDDQVLLDIDSTEANE